MAWGRGWRGHLRVERVDDAAGERHEDVHVERLQVEGVCQAFAELHEAGRLARRRWACEVGNRNERMVLWAAQGLCTQKAMCS